MNLENTNFGNGWIKLYRKIQGKGYYKKSQYVHLWVHLLLNANHEDAELFWNGQNIKVLAGQLLTGRKTLSEETGISESSIERILKMLETEQQIEQQKTTKNRLITITYWKDYQQAGQEVGQRLDNNGTTAGQQRDTNKKNKNNKKDNNEKKEDSGSVGTLPIIDIELVSLIQEYRMKENLKKIDDPIEVWNYYWLGYIPLSLQNQKFIEAWAEWVDYRREIKKKLTESSVKKQIKLLAKQSDPISIINRSIQNQYQGLFGDKKSEIKKEVVYESFK